MSGTIELVRHFHTTCRVGDAMRDTAPRAPETFCRGRNARSDTRRIALATVAIVREAIIRDVAQVDGKAVADKPSFFSATLGDESRPLGDRLRDLVAASARHNIGEIQRTINLPTFALIVVREENIGRFRFSRDRETSIRGVRSWVLRYVEGQRPTIVRGDQGRDVILQGLLWVDPETGRILRTMLSTHDALSDLHATIEVDYEADPRLDLWLPYEMREIYQHRRRHTVRAEAKYRNYRRFEVEAKVRGAR